MRSHARSTLSVLATLALLGAVPLASQSLTARAEGTDPAAEAHMSPQDRAIVQQVRQALQSDPDHFYRHVTVTANNGVVTLSGIVENNSSLDRAKQIAAGVHGVTKVDNQMQLQASGYQGGSDTSR